MLLKSYSTDLTKLRIWACSRKKVTLIIRVNRGSIENNPPFHKDIRVGQGFIRSNLSNSLFHKDRSKICTYHTLPRPTCVVLTLQRFELLAAKQASMDF